VPREEGAALTPPDLSRPPAGYSNQPEPPPPSAADPSDPDRRICPSCQASNPLSAEFCWQCLARLPGAAAPAASSGSSTGRAGQSGPGGTTSSVGGYEDRTLRVSPIDSVVPLPASPQRSAPAFVRVVIPLAIVALLIFGYRFLFGGGPKIPDTIGGLPRIENGLAKSVLEDVKQSLEKSGLKADLAYFGENGQPSMYVVVLQGKDPPPIEELFAQLASLGGTATLGTTSRREWKGASYLCAPASGIIKAACVWNQEDVVGMVASYDREVQPTFEFAIAAHDAIQEK
jgi:ribosomal protein L40E